MAPEGDLRISATIYSTQRLTIPDVVRLAKGRVRLAKKGYEYPLPIFTYAAKNFLVHQWEIWRSLGVWPIKSLYARDFGW